MAQVLRQLPVVQDPNLLVGINTHDDAAVYRLSDDLALVQTVDYFTPIVDDPYDFGAIAVANALSDVYAMGGRPLLALNIVGFPVGKLPLHVLLEITRGGGDKAREAGVSIIGGHTIDDPEPKYGLAVTGLIHPQQVITNAGARPGDALVLTKPIGTGIIATALKAGRADADAVRVATAVMTTLNKAASEAMLEVGVHACTDVTGFGLLGHLHEMVAGSNVAARVHFSQVPLLPGVEQFVKQQLVPGGTHRNRAYFGQFIDWGPDISLDQQLLLCDAQTSGGLLVAVPAPRLADLLAALARAQTPVAAVIGEVLPDPVGRIVVTR